MTNAYTKGIFGTIITAFILFLFLPLVINIVIAFNDSNIPSLPFKGFTLDWFYNAAGIREGLFNDERMIQAIGMSCKVAFTVSFLTVVFGTTAAFLFVREKFLGRDLLYFLVIAPLVIPGVILGISLLTGSHDLIELLRNVFGKDVTEPITSFLRPGFWLVIIGQFPWIAAVSTLIISAGLKKIPKELEEAAMDLGASRLKAIFSVTIKNMTPSIISAFILSFLLSFENFPTTLMLIGPEPTLPIYIYSKLRFAVTPELNALSLLLIMGTAILGILGISLRARNS